MNEINKAYQERMKEKFSALASQPQGRQKTYRDHLEETIKTNETNLEKTRKLLKMMDENPIIEEFVKLTQGEQ